MNKVLFAAVAVLCASAARAQAPYLVSDLNTSFVPNAMSSSPRFFAAAGANVFFAGSNDTAGSELFKTDGTTVELVKDIVPGIGGSGPAYIIPLTADTVVFSAFDSANGRELWKSDGTATGTVLVKDIYIGGLSSSAQPVAAMSGRVFLLASSTGQLRDVWSTDGTDSGTRRLCDCPEATGFNILGSSMYFYSGSTLWRSDGTPEGTSAVRTDPTIRALTAAGTHLFFAGWDSAHGYELWISDGTADGTILLKDINPGAGNAFNTLSSFSFVPVGSSIVFFAYDPVNAWSFWRSDGTVDGTFPYKSFATASNTIPPLLSRAGGLAFFSSDGLWRTDGTAPGTFKLGNVTSPFSFVTAPSAVFFFGRTTTGPIRLWSTDGTDAGTSVVSSSVAPGNPTEVAWTGGQLFFSGSDGSTGSEPWVSDGTENGTHLIANMVTDPPASSNPDNMRGTTGRVFFTATSSAAAREIWTSDGTSPGTLAITNFLGSKAFSMFMGWKGNLLFTTISDTSSLYFSDGTAVGTSELKKAYISLLFGASDYFYFSAPSGDSYYRIPWRSDGTEAGTIDLSTSLGSKPVEPSSFVELGGRVYFEAGDPRGLWQTDGTPESTLRLTTHPVNYTSISAGPVVAGGMLYYALNTSVYGTELWRTDPNRQSTTVIDARPGPNGLVPDQMTAAGPLVFFVGDNGTSGREVWRSDGTTAGTFLLKDVMPGLSSSSPRSLTAVGNRLFFVANDGLDGTELWTSDGTTAGTIMVADLAPGAASSSPDSLVAADGLLWFSADDASSGRELWKSDGTPAGTQRVADLNPGPSGSDPRQLVVGGRKLFFSAQTSTGRELWALDLSPVAYRIADARVVEGNSGTTPLHFKVTRSGDLSQASTVAFATSSGTAASGTDFVAASGSVSFPAGIAEAFIDVDVNGDTEPEGDETLFVTLSSPSMGVIENPVATGIIDDDDGSAALSVAYVQTSSYSSISRTFVVTNTGPSPANGVTFRFSESPTTATLSSTGCIADGYGILTCMLGTLSAGESRTILISRYESYGALFNSGSQPGFTITATVSTSTPEPNLSDNSIVRMTTSDGSLLTPPFLTSSTPATLEYLSPNYGYSSQTVQPLSSNPAVTITPSSVTLAPAERYAAFTLQPSAATGTTRLSLASYGSQMTIAIVSQGTVPKLDPVILAAVPYSVKYGQNLQITARIAARTADGTYPTGTLALLDQTNAVVDQQTPDSKGSVTFVRTGMQPGAYVFSLRYDGDDHFTPLTVSIGTIRIDPYSTSQRLFAPPVVCGTTADVKIIISTSDTTQAPPGTVTFTAGSDPVQATLVPTGAPGVSQATASVAVSSTATYIYATYAPSGPFGAGYQASRSISVGCAMAMNLVAVATGIDRVSLTWSGSASSYEIQRYSSDYQYWQFLGYAAAATFLDTTVSPGRAYLYRVRPTNTVLFSAPDLATTFVFTDDPIVAGSTTVKAAHFTELLTAVNSVRQLAGLNAMAFSNGPSPGALVSTTPVVELRAGLAEGLLYAGMPAVTFTDPSLASHMLIKAAHVQELRNGMK
jgi:ELWxxDGT repeat protein